MSKVEQRSRTTARTHAGRAGVGLALAATTAVGVAVPAAQASAAPPQPHTTLHGGSVGATALAARPVAAVPVMTYRVQAGDTVSHIALRTGSSVAAIVKANSLDSRALIRVGQMLKVPSAASTSAAPAAASPAPASPRVSTTTTTHTVRAGDTVSALAKQYGTTVSAIVKANNLRSAGLIYVGQRLAVGATAVSSSTSAAAPAAAAPATPSAVGTHTVRSGDTLSALAKQYGTTVGAIVKANDLRSAGLIYVGQRLAVGAAASAPAAPKPAAAATPAATVASGNHTVRAGETVSGLAKKWGTTVAAVIDANKLSSSGLIYVGQRLTVPGAPAPSTSPTQQLVPNSFLGRTYPEATVASANANKATLLAMGVPSRAEMQALVVRVAREMGVDPALAQAHAYQESGFNHTAVSPANAIGTMQVIPTSGDWASDLVGRKLNLLDPYDNVVAGVAIIRQLQRTSPDLETGIAGYYQGAGSVKRNGLFSDTEFYVASIKAHMKRF
ncbi:lytic transglycosylase domain-containing protein [Georgenia subflava]|uniref:LysM peptidoglycan-binding domain-containing protein n=1 Tax=Georgenia subflava TaxID=1622177 RepID=A0A6N7EKW5_9MICO|nr:lytic transglycosylase domain-containing protein [Georgenia subflava]MPV37673.1 LysM peptidoglycan-binding domain-containing protein [Georgenia subflava]